MSKRTYQGSYEEQVFRRVIKIDMTNILVTGANIHTSEWTNEEESTMHAEKNLSTGHSLYLLLAA